MNKKTGAASAAKRNSKRTKKQNWGGDMPQRTQFLPKNISLSEMVSFLTKSERERLVSGYDLKTFAKVFEDEDLMLTVDSFFKYGMNVSETARILYMHRNTLIYRLKKIKNITGFDISNFEMAITFQLLRLLYGLKWGDGQ